jgi:hypothetical protein
MEKCLGRYLNKNEIIHHRGDKYQMSSKKNMQDNRIENLQLCQTQTEHLAIHKEHRKCEKYS